MELIHFIFSGPWIFIGFIILIAVVGSWTTAAVRALRGPVGRCSQCLGPYVKPKNLQKKK